VAAVAWCSPFSGRSKKNGGEERKGGEEERKEEIR
jgi:hypothetical protein